MELESFMNWEEEMEIDAQDECGALNSQDVRNAKQQL